MNESITLEGGAVVTYDPDKKGECSKCGEEIYWAQTKNSKWMPISEDDEGRMESHFAACPFAKDFRRKA